MKSNRSNASHEHKRKRRNTNVNNNNNNNSGSGIANMSSRVKYVPDIQKWVNFYLAEVGGKINPHSTSMNESTFGSDGHDAVVPIEGNMDPTKVQEEHKKASKRGVIQIKPHLESPSQQTVWQASERQHEGLDEQRSGTNHQFTSRSDTVKPRRSVKSVKRARKSIVTRDIFD